MVYQRQFFAKTTSLILLSLLLFGFSSTVFAIETAVKDFTLSQNQPYTDTGIDLAIGDSILIRQYGSAALYPSGRTVAWVSTPGDPGCVATAFYSLPGVNCWSLIARIGNNQPFYVGSEFSGPVLAKGRLYLGINHQVPLVASGSYHVRVIANYTPPPPPPSPFLDLPWGYRGVNKSFEDAALAINSFFDHEYPLISSGLSEPLENKSSVLTYENKRGVSPYIYYSSHDGYDWGRGAGAGLGADVLAAGSGCATYVDNTYTDEETEKLLYRPQGEQINIDHGNHYQTRYYHLEPGSTITTSTSTTECLPVLQGDVIGRVGLTGNVKGAHLHFMVVEDKNRDGNFQDNIPDGITDPFGWNSQEPDPWPQYSFEYNKEQRSGNDSHYLWTQPIPELSQSLPKTGGSYVFGKTSLSFPSGAVLENSTISFKQAPVAKLSEILESVGTTVVVTVQNLFGSDISQFNQPFVLTFDFSDKDLSRFKPDSLSIYSSSDGIDWSVENSFINQELGTASTTLDHLTQFALVGERIDTTPPETQAALSGSGLDSTFNSQAVLTLEATDDYSGVDYTAYRLDPADSWQEYVNPLFFDEAGLYTVEFFSIDNHENSETIQSTSFQIVTQQPEVVLGLNNLNKPEVSATGSGQLETKLESINTFTNKLIITDSSDQVTTLVYQSVNLFGVRFTSLKTIQYNNQNPVEIIDNLHTFYTTKLFAKPAVFQSVWVKNHEVVSSLYSTKYNKSYVTGLEGGQKEGEVVEGFKVLQLVTDNGQLSVQ